MVRALSVALAAAEIDPRDTATVNLARLLAKAVDDGQLQHAPKLLQAMTALGLSPAGRKPAPVVPVAAEGPDDAPSAGGGESGAAALAELRAARSSVGA